MGKRDENQELDETPSERGAQDRILSALSRRALSRKHGSLPTASDVDDELLLRYADGALTGAERTAFERRVLADADVRERLGILTGGLTDTGHARPTQPAGIVDRATRQVFHVAHGLLELLRGGEGATQLATASLRGNVDPGRPTAFQIDRMFQTATGPLAARFELHAERADVAGDAIARAALVDLVVHVGADGAPVEGVRCKLLRDGRPIDSREVEAVGCTFTRLGPARYDVELRKGGVEIGRVLFDLRG